MARNHLRLSLPFKTIFRKQNKNKNKTNNTLFLLIWHCFGMTRRKKAAKIVHCCNGKMIVFSVSEWGRRKTRWMMFFLLLLMNMRYAFVWIFFFFCFCFCVDIGAQYWLVYNMSDGKRCKIVGTRERIEKFFCSNAFTRLWIIWLLHKHICKQWHSNRFNYFDKWEMSKCYVLFVVYLKTDFEVCQSNAQLWRFYKLTNFDFLF